MICRECANAYAPTKDKGDADMVKMGYRACRAANTPIERARWVKGDTPCNKPERFKAK